MAVHLNARLNTRFIPILFAVAILTSLISSFVHASSEIILPDPQQLEYEVEDLSAAPDGEALARDRFEVEEILRESIDPTRIDRVPGFSPTQVVAVPSPESAPVAPYTIEAVSDSISMQPGEAEAR